MDSKQSLNQNDVLFKEGQPAKTLYLVKDGEVLCLKKSHDRMIPIFRAKEGDLIGESAIQQNAIYGYSAIALSECELIPVSAKSFEETLKDAPAWLADLTTTMIQRFQRTANLVAENRLSHPSILSEELTPSQEIEFKKLLS